MLREQGAGSLYLPDGAEPLEDDERGCELRLRALAVAGDHLRQQQARPRLFPARPDRGEALGGPGEELSPLPKVVGRGRRPALESVGEEREGELLSDLGLC